MSARRGAAAARGRIVLALRRYRYETLRQIGWPLYRVVRFTS